MEIIIIVAMAENRVIGKDNAMPWDIKGNLARFKEVTMGWPCIMGRKTWESLPKKPLPGRLNIVISKTITTNDLSSSSSSVSFVPSCLCAMSSLEAALDHCKDYEKVFIIGGESIYKQAMPVATKIDLTLIPGNYEGDASFPEIDTAEWKIINKVDFERFSILTYIKMGLGTGGES